MATALPRNSRQSMAAPHMAEPANPLARARQSALGIPRSQTPRTSLRAPSAILTNSPATNPGSHLKSPPLSAPLSSTGSSGPLRRAISVAAFPQPPSGDTRNSAVPARSRSTQKSSSRLSRESLSSTSINSPISGETGFINSARMSDSLMSITSPTHSRSSSAQDSYSTAATIYDDLADAAGASMADKRSSKTEGLKGNVTVSVRVRPDANADNNEGDWVVDSRTSLIAYRGKEGGEYYYDNVFATNDNNARVYDHSAKRLVRRVMEGYHGTVFAYGQTGTGKTFSMQGTATSPGVIPLAITDIFSYIRETPSREFLLRVSYLEIYNEKIHDLLSMSTAGAAGNGPQEEIKLREDSKRGVYATPLKEEIVQSPTQLLRVIARGDQARRVASTQFNSRSSRSHAVVQIVVESRERMAGSSGPGENKRSAVIPGGVRVSTLSLIDLAGSEKAAESKERRQEGAHINKSLLTLGTVIAKLSEWKDKGSDGKEGKHLPYRDSKLTRLLQGALSGDSLVSILCTIQVVASGAQANASTHINETLNTLKFASRAKNSIVSHAKKVEEAGVNGVDGTARVLLERYRMEIAELRQQLESQAGQKTGIDKELVEEERAREREATERHEEQMLEMQLARTALKERIDHLNRLILSSKSIGVNSSGTSSSAGRYSQISMPGSVRSSVAAPSSHGGRGTLERTSSSASTSSAVGKRASGDGGEGIDVGGDDGVEEFGDGLASLAAQNRALQADLADKTRYIATLEKRLVQARRASASRPAPTKGIMVGEDHSVAAVLSQKDAEIAELRARLEDKDRMLAALRNATRQDPPVDASGETTRPASPQRQGTMEATPWSPSSNKTKRRTQSVDEMNKMLEEMIQDRVEKGHIVRGARGSVRLASAEALGEPPSELPPLRHVPSAMGAPPISAMHFERLEAM